MSQLCTCHNSRAVLVCAKLWHDLIIIFTSEQHMYFLSTRFGSWVHKLFVKCILGPCETTSLTDHWSELWMNEFRCLQINTSINLSNPDDTYRYLLSYPDYIYVHVSLIDPWWYMYVSLIGQTWWYIYVSGGGGGGGGGTRSGFIRGCAAPGSEPLPYFRESRILKTYPILGKSHNPGHPKRSGLQKHTLF